MAHHVTSPNSPLAYGGRFDLRENRESLQFLETLLRLDKKSGARAKEKQSSQKEYMYALRSPDIVPKVKRHRPGLLRVDLIQGKNLKPADAAYLGGPLVNSDPFCKLSILCRSPQQKVGSEKFFTTAPVISSVVKQDVNPRWNETFRFKIYQTQNTDILLRIEVYDESFVLGIAKETFLGAAEINVKEVLKKVSHDGKVEVTHEADVMYYEEESGQNKFHMINKASYQKYGSVIVRLSQQDLFAIDKLREEEEKLIEDLKSGEGMRRDTMQRMSIIGGAGGQNDPRFNSPRASAMGNPNFNPRMSILPQGAQGAGSRMSLLQQAASGSGPRMSVLHNMDPTMAGRRMSVLPPKKEQPTTPRKDSGASAQAMSQSPPK